MDKTVPPGRVKGTLTPPCSKSYAQRALAAALLSEEVSVLRNIEFCDDTRSALQCIETLGARVRRVDPTSLSIEGGLSPKGCVLNVGESGLSTRLFTPVASLCPTPVTIEGRGSLLRRPMQMMFEPLRRLGVRVRDNGGFLPIEVCGPIQGGEAEVDGSVSSQFITGLLLALPLAGLLREHRDVAHGDLSGRGARHQQHRRGAPVALDAEIGRTVALPSGDVELLVVALADFDAEARGRVESHI